MKKRLPLILFFFFIIGFDQLTKYWSYQYLPLEGASFFFLDFGVKFNHGISAGLFSKVNPIAVALLHVSVGFTLIPIFLALIYFLPQKMFRLKVGVILLMSSILSNVMDRIIQGAVVDFISFSGVSVYFNFADILILFSIGLILLEIFSNDRRKILKGSRRKNLVINPHFQFKFIVIIVGFMSCFFMASSALQIVFYSMAASMLPAEYFSRSDLIIGLSFQFLILINFCSLAYFFFRKYGNSIAGPIYAFKKFVIEHQSDKSTSLNLREHDEFKKELGEIATLIKKES